MLALTGIAHPRRTAGMRAAALLFASILPTCEPTAPGPGGALPADHGESPTPDLRLAEIRSSSGRWRAWAEFLPDESLQTVLEGEGRTDRFSSARPIAFTDDDRRLILAATSGDLVEGLYVLTLGGGSAPVRITNRAIRQSPVPPVADYLPCPIDTNTSWRAGSLTYAVPGDGQFVVNVDTGEWHRDAP